VEICESAVLIVIKRCCNQGDNKSNHPSFSSRVHPTRDSTLLVLVAVVMYRVCKLERLQ
jgi:hypothetical protein